jgi:toxin YoeB
MKTDDILFTPEAFEDYRYWQGEDKKTLKRINALIDDILRNGNEGIGKPELLKNNFSGFYSRRIDDKNRLIYRIEKDIVIIIACRTHYKDK